MHNVQSIQSNQNIKGRCVELRSDFVTVRNLGGYFEVRGDFRDQVSLGDIIEVSDEQARVLTPNRSPGHTMKWMQRILEPRRIKGLQVRSQVESGIRRFFQGQGFTEVRTPLLVACPGMEPHIPPFRVNAHHVDVSGSQTESQVFLPTSPEFAMKRLLVGGLERIFQIAPSFRNEPVSPTHQPEFMMLEWYRAYAGYEDIMRDTESLFESMALSLFGKPCVSFQGKEISVKVPWPRLRVRDLFLEFAQVDLVACPRAEDLLDHCKRLGLLIIQANQANGPLSWDDLYFIIWLNVIEPKLPENQAVFVTRYPTSQAALSVVDRDPDGSSWARRFEVYAGGLELGNAFEELTDPVEQRRRFIEDMELRRRLYGPTLLECPLDEGFLGALEEGMPPAGGIAVGVDRMVMFFGDEPELEKTLWLEPHV
ncbi:EF-P lysine aminoacylase EpmA [Bdellovibrionota bacterium FG-2]